MVHVLLYALRRHNRCNIRARSYPIAECGVTSPLNSSIALYARMVCILLATLRLYPNYAYYYSRVATSSSITLVLVLVIETKLTRAIRTCTYTPSYVLVRART